MTLKQTIRRHNDAFKNEAVKLVLEQGYSVPQAAKALGIATKAYCISGTRNKHRNQH